MTKKHFLYWSVYMEQLAWFNWKSKQFKYFQTCVKKHYSKFLLNKNNVYMCICVSVCVYVCVSVVYIYTYRYILVCFPLTYPWFYPYFYILSCFSFFSLFTILSQLCSEFRDRNENKAFLPVLCCPSHCLMLFIFVCSSISTSAFIF